MVEQLAVHLAANHGVVTKAEALALGVTEGQIRRRTRTGEWIRLHRGVYRLAAAPDIWEARTRAAALSARGLASHGTALRVWRVDGFSRMRAIHVTTRPQRSTGSLDHPDVPVRVHRSRCIELAGGRLVGGIPATSVTRAVLDLASIANDSLLEQTVDAVVRQRFCSLADLTGEVKRHGTAGRSGAGRLSRLIAAREPSRRVPDSRFNRLVGQLLVRQGLPVPEYELEIATGNQSFRVDLAYAEQRVAIECDSARWHHNRTSFEADPRRRNLLLNAGFRVFSFTWADYADHPQQLVGIVRAALKTEVA